MFAHIMYVQCKLFCRRRTYCDFLGWTDEDAHIKRIHSDEELWLSCVEKAHLFFRNTVLPELLGKRFSRPARTPITHHSEAHYRHENRVHYVQGGLALYGPAKCRTPARLAIPRKNSLSLHCWWKLHLISSHIFLSQLSPVLSLI